MLDASVISHVTRGISWATKTPNMTFSIRPAKFVIAIFSFGLVTSKATTSHRLQQKCFILPSITCAEPCE